MGAHLGASRRVNRRILTRYSQTMRTTITLADDVAAAVEKLRRERSIGLSEAVNDLVRAELTEHPGRTVFRQQV